jgi:hypothetical protein
MGNDDDDDGLCCTPCIYIIYNNIHIQPQHPPTTHTPLYTHTNHKPPQFLETLFDVKRAKEKKIAAGVAPVPIPEAHARVLSLLHEQVGVFVTWSSGGVCGWMDGWMNDSRWSVFFFFFRDDRPIKGV